MARELKYLILLMLFAIGMWLVYQLVRITGSDIQALRWHSHAATISSTAYDNQVEIEIDARVAAGIPGHAEPEGQTPRNPANRQILVPATPGAIHMHGTEIILLQNPADPGQVRILSHFAMLAVPVVYLIGLLAVGFIALRLYRSRWGEDVMWKDGGWHSDYAGQPPGAQADESATRRYPKTGFGGFWTIFFGIGATAACYGAPWRSDASAAATCIALLIMTTLASLSWLHAATRRIQCDALGIADASFFGTYRLAWADVGTYQHLDLREKARRRARIGSRPSSIYMHHFRDRTGKLVLELSDELANEYEIEKRLGRSHGD